MRINEGFVLRDVLDQHVVIGEGIEQMNFNKMIVLNESAALMWRSIENKEFSVEDLAKTLTCNYEVDEQTALEDAAAAVAQWKEEGLLAGC